jgi:hypothetical protein
VPGVVVVMFAVQADTASIRAVRAAPVRYLMVIIVSFFPQLDVE